MVVVVVVVVVVAVVVVVVGVAGGEAQRHRLVVVGEGVPERLLHAEVGARTERAGDDGGGGVVREAAVAAVEAVDGEEGAAARPVRRHAHGRLLDLLAEPRAQDHLGERHALGHAVAVVAP